MGKDLFTYQSEQFLKRNAPLAERLRPKTLDDFVGQSAVLAEGRLLRRAIKADRVGNLLLHGPPGVGKTTLAKIIAANTRSHFTILNAVLAGVKELRYEVDSAKERLDKYRLRTILFIDEVHRFNSAQQDALLPWVENGTLTLIGATTENPYFEVNKALVSRFRLFRLQHLGPEDLKKLVDRALTDSDNGYGSLNVQMTIDAVNHLVNVSNGDARSLLNALELAVESTSANSEGYIKIDLKIAEESIQERAVLYDKQGDAHFDTISAFIKSLRGSDPDAALFWLARMVEAGENPRFIFRRMLIAAAEDVGLADPQAVVVVEACAAAFERIGLPEGLYPLAQAALYLATTEKSNSLLGFFEAQRTVREAQRQDIPVHLKDAHRDKAAFGDGVGYRYPHAFVDHWVAQQYLPNALQGEVFWNPSKQGWEGKRRSLMLDRRAAQLAAGVESMQEYPFLLSDVSETPQFERWLQRQLTQQGDRLQELLERLWSGVQWQCNDRVLIVGGRSLLWALTPLKSVPEGGVTILGSCSEDLSRLSAQLEILDPLKRPNLINDSCDELNKLEMQFEWIGGRIHSKDLIPQKFVQFWEMIRSKCHSNSRLRILLTAPEIGPAESLLAILPDNYLNEMEQKLMNELIKVEHTFLFQKQNEAFFLETLKINGWHIKVEEWSESLHLKVNNELELRWLGSASFYRELICKNSLNECINIIKKALVLLHEKDLPQKLIQKKIIGEFVI